MMITVEAGRFVLVPKLNPAEVLTLQQTIHARQIQADLKTYAVDLESRHIRHAGNAEAVRQLRSNLEEIGRTLPPAEVWTVRLDPFVYNPRGEPRVTLNNVEATLSGTGPIPFAKEIVIVSAHLDSTGSREPAYQPRRDPAPGADDDASGIAGVLGAARAIVALLKDHSVPHREIRFLLFNAEEAHQQGSRWYVDKLPAPPDITIKAVYHMDMIGFDTDGVFQYELHAGFNEPTSAKVEIESIAIATLLCSIAPEVSSGLVSQIHHSDQAGCTPDDPGQDISDHTSFHKGGFPACLVTENFFPCIMGPAEPNPDYHLREDTVDNVKPEYAARIARAVAAAAWYMATR